MELKNVLVFVFGLALTEWHLVETRLTFPDSFLFGAASASYQVEGAWNVSGKGINVWDEFTHSFPERIADGSNGDVAMDSYHLYQKDVNALKYLEANLYRFSISWSRLLPTGFVNQSNPDGIRYYNNLINSLLKNGVEPVVTLYHWDMPEPLHKLGGFTNRDVIPYFVDYAKFVFEQFGDRVKYWSTINEINVISVAGYARNMFAPGIDLPGRAEYLCVHNMLLAHAYTYRMFHEQLDSSCNQGIIGLTIHAFGYYTPSNKPDDLNAAEIAQQFIIGWVLNPLLTEQGDYPSIMKTIIERNSLAQNYERSRLPEFTPEEIDLIKGTIDFLGVNHYTTFLYSFEPINDTSYATPLDIRLFVNGDFPVHAYRLVEWPYGDYELFSIYPNGFRDVLIDIKNKYGNPSILITENGYNYRADDSNLNDFIRVGYINQYLTALMSAVKQFGVDVFGYIVWSLTDTFEWNSGYTMQFGLFHVNHSTSTKNRVGRLSSRVYKNIIKTRQIDFNYLPLINNDAVTY